MLRPFSRKIPFSFSAAALTVLLVACSSSTRENVTIYEAASGPVKGWSHIVTNPEKFPLIALAKDKYAVDDRSVSVDEASSGKRVFRTVLVRKMSNWGQQHANGIEPVFFDRPLKVGDVDTVTLRIKLNAEDSMIPTPSDLSEHYGGHLSEEQVYQLDRGIPCLGLTFVEPGYNDQSVESLNAVYFLEFDPERDFDRWLELTLPLSDFTFGFEENYAFRKVARSEVQDRELIGFRINPEATGGGVARNFIGDDWDDSVPELYKELSISLESVTASVQRGGE
ncbi:hypothetical protein [Pelagicoccus sp. SDUM812002]|uniref:hypothetical protein n=1 Tax=Pelagicoccus sp. SDUM812002 TaxID=3041266 RepID=UPI00280FFE15|nr:hypothetical protein [Pelagicoccus sp. SDUM812002]MDQ8187526.1 hypothetical protein [Pelagicoccus sp. SDUM812002]